MTRKIIYTCIISIIMGGIQLSCSEDIPDCPSTMCLLTNENGWQLVALYRDGIKDSINITKYKIVLTMPNNKAAQGNFARSFTDGSTDTGTWETGNDNKELILQSSLDIVGIKDENYIIDTFTPRELILILNRDINTKTGPSQFKYVFEPI